MITVLHAGMLNGRFTLWAERSPATQAAPKASLTRKRKAQNPAPHPFAASDVALAEALREAGVSFEVTIREASTVAVWLPSAAGVPWPSSPLVVDTDRDMDPPGAKEKPAIAPWTVTGIDLANHAAIDLLCRCAGQTTLAPGIAIGADLAFWSHVLRLAGSLVARQRFLPGVIITNDTNDGLGQGRAVWEPAPSADDFEKSARLAGSAPALARALAQADATEPPAVPARDMVHAFLAVMVDHLVRTAQRGSGTPELPKRHNSEAVRAILQKLERRRRAAFASLHDRWLQALGSADGVIHGNPEELAALAEEVRSWREPLAASEGAPYRLCFRLEEPTGEPGEVRRPGKPDKEDMGPAREQAAAEAWSVHYLLQAADDPSLLIPAEEAWAARGRKAAAIKRQGADPKQFLLAALGQAAGICPRIEASLRTRTPAGYSLDVQAAHEFLSEKSLLLEQAGFGLMLPAWWSRQGTKLRLSMRGKIKSPKLQGGSGLDLDRILSFAWEVALGDQTLTRAELEELARLKAPLVRLRGQWVEMTASDIRAAMEVWKKKAAEKVTVREVIEMAVGARQPDSVLGMDGISADGWVGDLLARLDGRLALDEQQVPRLFTGTLRPYQARGYAWLAFRRELGMGACLADDMGLGKTIQTLALLQRDRERGEAKPVLLVCPTSVVSNWQREALRFTPELRVLVHHGIGRMKGAEFVKEAKKHALVLSSYALLHRDIEYLQKIQWAGVILDEAQNIKNPETKQAHAARSLRADYRLALTGTPVENNVGDLWSIMEFLNPGLLGTQESFRKRFFLPIQVGRDPQAAGLLKRITAPFVLRRLKTDRTIIDDLPDKLEMPVYCGLTREQVSLYQAVVKEAEEAIEEAEGIQRKGLVLATLSKLKQVCNHPAQFLGDKSAIRGRSGKLARLTEMLEEVLAAGDRTLVFTQFAEMGEILKTHIQEAFGREVPFLHGGVAKKRRDEMVERFQSEGGPQVFLLSLKAGGTGLNLTRASHVFHFDRWWNPAVEDQATDRAFRIGQTQNVQVYKFVCAGTLEETIAEMIERKKEVAASVVGTGEGWLTELSNDELRKIFALRAAAIGD